MSLDPLVNAFRVSPDSRLGLRIAKRALIARAASAEGDSTLIDTLVERAEWHAALRPAVLGIHAFADDTRDYPEIAVVTLSLRTRPGKADFTRLQTLLHSAVAKPLLLLLSESEGKSVALSIAHKSRHARDTARRVAEAPRSSGWFDASTPEPAFGVLLEKLPPAPGTPHLFALYDGWRIALTDLEIALRLGVVGQNTPATSVPGDDPRPALLAELAGIDRNLAKLRSAMAKAKSPGERSSLAPEIMRLHSLKTSLEEKLR